MAKYIAHIHDCAYPMKPGQWIEGKRIDAINRAILKTGKAWPGLELPQMFRPESSCVFCSCFRGGN